MNKDDSNVLEMEGVAVRRSKSSLKGTMQLGSSADDKKKDVHVSKFSSRRLRNYDDDKS